MKILAGDIGGTKTTLAVFDVSGVQLETLDTEKYSSRDHDSLNDIVRQYLGGQAFDCETACFGIAGPVRNGKARTTNLPWEVDAQQMAADLGLKRVSLINDLEANAWGIGALGEDDFFTLNEGKPSAGGNACIISAGTGLGEAGLYRHGDTFRPFASEGGHSDFSPHREIEIELLRFLTRRFQGHVSWERAVSGSGLVNLHDFLCEYRKVAPPGWLVEQMKQGDAAAAISMAGQSGRCPLCLEALDLFVRLYGSEAGNLALKIMATGGVYIGGGIAPKLLWKIREPAFLHAFCDKGRMRHLMEDMPVKVILNDRAALFGPALYAARRAEAGG